MSRLDEVMQRLHDCGLKLKSSKCEIFKPSLKFLGHIISAGGIETDPEYIEAVQHYPAPTTVKELQRFLGLAGYYRRFIQDYAGIATPLTTLLRGLPKGRGARGGRVKIAWGPAQRDAFSALKHALTVSPVLAYPDYSRPFLLRTDASLAGIGGILLQQGEEKKPRVVAYGSRALRPAEKNYSTYRLEFLALYWAITQKFRPYLEGASFTVTTDHNPLIYIRSSAKLDATGQRWTAELARFDFDIRYKPGINNCDADALSRAPVTRISEETAVTRRSEEGTDDDSPTEVQIRAITATAICDWEIEQDRDEEIREMKRELTEGSGTSGAQRSGLRRWKGRLMVDRRILYRRSTTKAGLTSRQIIVPAGWRRTVFQHCHDSVGHPGRKRTARLVKARFFWVGQTQDIREWCINCMRCKQAKGPYLAERTPLVSITTCRPLEVVGVDYLGVPLSKGGFSNILVMIDHFTKFMVAVPTRNQTGPTTAKAIYHHLILPFGIPERIHSDRGRNFLSGVMRNLYHLLGIDQSLTTPYHPMGNGLTERANRIILGMMKTLPEPKKLNWREHLPALVYAYNTMPQETTRYSPYFLMFLREPRLPVDLCLGAAPPPLAGVTEHQYVQDQREMLERVFTEVYTNAGMAKDRQKKNYDRRVRGRTLEVGDRVLVRNTGVLGSTKLVDNWRSDLYEVVGQPNPDIPVFRVRVAGGHGQPKALHRNNLQRVGGKETGVVPEPKEVGTRVHRTRRPRATEEVRGAQPEGDSDSSSDEETGLRDLYYLDPEHGAAGPGETRRTRPRALTSPEEEDEEGRESGAEQGESGEETEAVEERVSDGPNGAEGGSDRAVEAGADQTAAGTDSEDRTEAEGSAGVKEDPTDAPAGAPDSVERLARRFSRISFAADSPDSSPDDEVREAAGQTDASGETSEEEVGPRRGKRVRAKPARYNPEDYVYSMRISPRGRDSGEDQRLWEELGAFMHRTRQHRGVTWESEEGY